MRQPARGGGWIGAGESGQAAAPNPQPYLLTDGIGQILDLVTSASLSGYAFAQSVTLTLSLTAADNIGDGGTLELDGPRGIAVFESDGSTYAAVTVHDDNRVQILDVTDPSNVTAAGGIAHGGAINLNGTYGIATFTSGGSTYAAVAASIGDGVQILDITDPSAITAAGNITNTDALELDVAWDIAIFNSSGSTYAAVAAFRDDGVQILDITDPSNVTETDSIAHGGAINLDGAWDIATFTSGGSTYAAVTASMGDGGVQILDITNPSAITAAGNITDTPSLTLGGANGIAIFNSSGSTYAAVAAYNDNGVQILDITDPSAITAAGNITDTGALELLGASGIAVFEFGDSTYAAVAGYDDNGVQILDITDPSAITAAGNIADDTTLELFGAENIATFTSGGSIYAAVTGYDDDGVQILRLTAPPPPPPPDAFVTTWETTGAGQTVTIPATGTYSIDWGDGTVNATASGTQTHNYASAGNHTVAITGGLESININSLPSQPEKDRLRSIDQWGNITWTTMEGAFRGASNMAYDAADTPDLSGVASMNTMFRDTSFSANLSGWDVSQVTDTSRMFQGSSFNGDISGWDVSRVQNMRSMFSGASSFNQPLDTWNVSSATSMAYMFYDAYRFNQDLDSWNVSSVETMEDMFGSSDVNSAFNGNISTWDVSQVQIMQNMFNRASSFDQPLNDWDVSRVQSMRSMFSGASSFNQPLNDWNVSSATDMDFMFFQANDFDQNLGEWYVVLNSTEIDASGAPGVVGTISAQNMILRGQATYGIGAGGDSGSFNITGGSSLNMTVTPDKSTYTVNITSAGGLGDNNHRVYNVTVTGIVVASVPPPDAFVTTWETASAGETITIPVRNAAGNYTVHWGDGNSTTHVTDATHTYAEAGNHTVSISGNFTQIRLTGDATNAAKLQSIDRWGGIAWTTMVGAFEGAVNMTYNAADAPDLSGVDSMIFMFSEAHSFNGNLSGWNVSSVTGMSNMFERASSFNGSLSGWDVSSVTDMSNMFRNAASFNQPLNDWNVSSVTDMNYMFYDADSFNGDLSGWDVSSVTSMISLFFGADSFNGSLSGWDVSSVTSMFATFHNADSFNQPLNDWNVSSVTGMGDMFRSADSFNQPLNDWNVSSVTGMGNMFRSADSFNQPLNDWNVSSVINMFEMFRDATSFNQPISDWDIPQVTVMDDMFRGAAAFNQDISTWDVSSVRFMNDMFTDAANFDQNLGEWYVVLNSTEIDAADAPGVVGTISAQNQFLRGQNPTYAIGAGGDSGSFNITGGSDLNMNITSPAKSLYTVNITSAGGFSTPNHRVYDVTVTGNVVANNAPVANAGNDRQVNEGGSVTLGGSGSDTDGDPLTYSWSSNPLVSFDNQTSPAPTITASLVTGSTTITLTLTVSDGTASHTDTMDLTILDIPATNNAPVANAGNDRQVNEGGSVTLGGSGSDTDGDPLTYSWSQSPSSPAITFDNSSSPTPTVTAPQVGSTTTFTLTLRVEDDADSHTDTMDLTVLDVTADTTAPTVSSIERFDPSGSTTDRRTLVYGVTFSEAVTGVDSADFALSPDSTGGPDSGLFTQTNSPALAITLNNTVSDAITVPGSGTAASVSVAVNITHTYIGDLKVDLIAPDGTTQTLHNRTGSSTHNIVQTYTPDFAGVPIAGTWILRINDDYDLSDDGTLNSWTLTIDQGAASPVTAVSGSGATYNVTVSATTDGTYNLDLVSPGHNITDGSGNPLTVTAPTGADETYTVAASTTTDTGNRPPEASAGQDRTVNERSSVTLSGSAHDPDAGDTLTYAWTRVSGTPVTLAGDDTLRPQFTAPGVTSDEEIAFTFTATDTAGESAGDTVTITVRDVPISVSTARYDSGSGTMTITFNQEINQEINGAPDYSLLHVRGAGSDSGGIALSNAADTSSSGRTITATLSTAQQDRYDDLQSPQLDVEHGAVTDADGVPIREMLDITIRGAGSGTRSSTPPPAVDISALASAGVDVPKNVTDMAPGRGSGPIPPVAPDGTFDFPLVMDGLGYLLDGPVNTLVPHAVPAGQAVTIKVTVHDPTPIAYFAIYLNLQGDDASHLDSDAQVIWNYGQTYVIDRSGLMRDATVTLSEDSDDPTIKTFTITATLSEGMGQTNMAIRTWNADGQLAEVRIFDAITVTAPVSEPATVDPEPTGTPVAVDPEPAADDDSAESDILAIRMWSGFDPESISDAQLLASLGLDYPGVDIPSWVMTELGPLVVKGDVTIDEFKTALEYVLEHA